MEKISSRERVLIALNHQEPDRVPLDIGGASCTSIIIEGYDRLEDFLGFSGKTTLQSQLTRLAQLDTDMINYLGCDCLPIYPQIPTCTTLLSGQQEILTDVWGVQYKKMFHAAGGYYWERFHGPLEQASIEELESFAWPPLAGPDYTRGLAEKAKALYETTEYALVADGGFKNFFELACDLRGFERTLMDFAENQEFIHALMLKILEINIQATGCFLDAVGPYIQVFRVGDDLATQRGLLMSPKAYRDLLKPYHRKFIEFVKSKTDAKIFYHTCGKVTDLIGDLVEIGVDILNPVQVSALGDTAALKAQFGDRISFWGGIDTQHILPHGNVRDVKDEVKRRIHDLGPGGGYIVAPVHNIQPDVPPENIIAMVESTREYGKYPL
jgi:uroporphyrinogen decarboxylase